MVQQPEDAIFTSMPRSAIEAAKPDFVTPLSEIPHLLAQLAKEEVIAATATPSGKERLIVMENNTEDAREHEDKAGNPSVYTCPECSGTLWVNKSGELESYECRIGHSYSLSNLVQAKEEAVEQAMWTALRTLEENASLAQRMAERAGKRNLGMAKRWDELAKARMHDANLLREILTRGAATEPLAVNE